MKSPNRNSSLLPLLERQEAEQARWALCSNAIVRVDLGRRLVVVNSALITGLKTQDLIVLHLLGEEAVRSPGQALPMAELVGRIESGTRQRAWSWFGVTPELVHKAVYRLREALKAAGRNDALIETMPGRGYRLSTPNVVVATSGENLWRIAAGTASPQASQGENVSGATPG